MPSIEHGIKQVVISTLISIIIFTLLKGFAESNPEYESFISIFILVSFIAVIETIENLKYWGIGYTIGTIFGLFIIKPLLEEWEFTLLVIALFLTLVQKIWRKYFR